MKQINKTRLTNITLFYLERFESSSFKTRKMLERRIQKERLNGNIIPDNINTMIDEVIQKMIELGYINDERVIQNQVQRLSNSGKSKSFILNKLKQDGLCPQTVSNYLRTFDEETSSSDLTRAHNWLKKHKKGQFRIKDASLFYQKDLAALGRAGFSYEIAKQALEINPLQKDNSFD
ncbi:MAG: RecX family transcriptional regulator [Alphaproteobacteria bacterium]|nr:RecX family transcriptional regulator [Alphaproteobacteria bacterium]